jgi:hypothetical protein
MEDAWSIGKVFLERECASLRINTGRPMTRHVHPIFIASCAAFLVMNATFPSWAAYQVAHHDSNLYDGSWSVLIQTTQGNCPGTVRAGLRILAGRVLPTDQGYSVEGQVSPTGAIRVNVSAAGQSAGGSGHLSRNTGQGLWRTSSGECSGQWTAERREIRDGSAEKFASPKTLRQYRGNAANADW